jgi:hypothetical protein
MQTRMIEIDFQVHQMIELERQSFEDTPNAVLRRKYGLDAASAPTEPPKADSRAPAPVAGGSPFVGKGRSRDLNFTLPHGTELQMDYNTQHFDGKVDDGSLVFEGRRFSTPSEAADALCRTKSGRTTSLNGKKIIRVRVPGETKWALWADMEDELQRKMATVS